LPWLEMAKHKYLSIFEKHSLYFDALFGSLDCDCTPTQHLCKPKSFQILGANYK
jgi:hypothetical protein